MEESTFFGIATQDFDFYDIYPILIDNKAGVDFLVQEGGLRREILCEKCQEGICTLSLDKSAKNAYFYRCRARGCGARKTIYKGFRHDLPAIEIRRIILCAYLYSKKAPNFLMTSMCGISETSLISLKRVFSSIVSDGAISKIGGPGRIVQIDETACNRRRLITSPTSEEVFVRGTKWVIGAIEEETKEIRLSVLEDRSIENFYRFISENICEGTLIKSDGFRSYPSAVSMAGCSHRVVNHTIGFVAEDGTHTNIIESVWSHLKADIRARRGVMFSNLANFIKEWETYNNAVKLKTRAQMNAFFMNIIKSL